MSDETPAIVTQLAKLDHRGLKALTSHYESAQYYDKVESSLAMAGLLLALAATIIAAVIAVVDDAPSALRISAAVAGGLAAGATALRQQLQSGARGERHRQTAHRFSSARRQIEAGLARVADGLVPTSDRPQILEAATGLYDDAGKEAPSVPPHIWRHNIERYGGSIPLPSHVEQPGPQSADQAGNR